MMFREFTTRSLKIAVLFPPPELIAKPHRFVRFLQRKYDVTHQAVLCVEFLCAIAFQGLYFWCFPKSENPKTRALFVAQ
jgi:hypothetical protein